MSKQLAFPSEDNAVVIGVERSDNRKLSNNGSVSTTWVSQSSCPKTCAFYNNGCYAENNLAGLITKRLNQSVIDDADKIAQFEANAIDNLSGTRPLRLHVVGDCITNKGAKLVSEACERYMERGNQKVWSYTHAWRTVDRKSWGNVSIFASCETLQDCENAIKAGYAPAMVVKNFNLDKEGNVPKSYPIGALKAVPCPKQTHAKDSCKDCKLCWHANGLRDNNQVILFATHGCKTKKANQVLDVLNV